jgi:LPXTG-motif cell wall-anchored protein
MGRNRSSTVAFAAAYIVLVLGLFVALGGAAYAASSASPASNQECDESNSASDQYCDDNDTKVAGVKVSATAGGDTTSAAAADAAALPNTGLSLVGVVAVGGALVAAGVALRRRERRKS